MRRVSTKDLPKGMIPPNSWHAPQVRSLFLEPNTDWNSGCWNCPDQPCAKWSSTDLLSDGPDIGAIDSTDVVCPTGALSITNSGRPTIDEPLCIGCGLCVARCPVDAIRVDSRRFTATVAPSFEQSAPDGDAFFETRSAVAQKIQWERPPWSDANRVSGQVHRLRLVLDEFPTLAFASMRLLLRNSLLLAGLRAKLRRQGANSFAVEVAAEVNDSFLVAEVQASADTLDPFRRLLVGVAHLVGAQGFALSRLTPVVVIVGLPNSRADYFRLVSDARQYLDFEVRTVTAAWIFLAVRDQGHPLREIDHLPKVYEGKEGLGSYASKRFGRLEAKKCELDPIK